MFQVKFARSEYECCSDSSLKMLQFLKSFFNELQVPEYKDKKHDGYEEREYLPSVWVSTSKDLIDADETGMKKLRETRREMFFKLFRYIQGANDAEQKIEMTAPVAREIIPGQGPACETKYTMSFYMQREFSENPPNPTESDVFIKRLPAMTVFVKTFGGNASEETYLEEMKKFIPVLERDGHQLRDDIFYFAGYDSPFKLFNRTNEVWVVKKTGGDSAGGGTGSGKGEGATSAPLQEKE
ncbi:heme-binding protein 2-like isoform X2 [Diadema setosum]|uniref:heme-binding protein 2-like isoform X2 n=1 Tax=Diadema setosum TaxID=31175 RepID=UPI003B3B3365